MLESLVGKALSERSSSPQLLLSSGSLTWRWSHTLIKRSTETIFQNLFLQIPPFQRRHFTQLWDCKEERRMAGAVSFVMLHMHPSPPTTRHPSLHLGKFLARPMQGHCHGITNIFLLLFVLFQFWESGRLSNLRVQSSEWTPLWWVFTVESFTETGVLVVCPSLSGINGKIFPTCILKSQDERPWEILL